MGRSMPQRQQRSVIPTIERRQLRTLLFREYRGIPSKPNRRYMYILAQDLRPLWANVEHACQAQGWDLGVHIHDTLRPEESTVPIDLPELSFPELVAWSPWLQDVFLNTYIASVYRMVKDKLHLTDHGKPAQWAARAVHADVVRRDFPDADDGLLDPVPLWISAGKPR